MKHLEIKKVLAHFKGKPVNNKVLAEHCNLNRFDLITEGAYEDYLFQQEHDERAQNILQLIFAE